jgi:hypothetical protein
MFLRSGNIVSWGKTSNVQELEGTLGGGGQQVNCPDGLGAIITVSFVHSLLHARSKLSRFQVVFLQLPSSTCFSELPL